MSALSAAVDREIADVLSRRKFATALSAARREHVLDILRANAVWFTPTVRVDDCRDAKDNMYLELALASGAGILVGSDEDLLVLHPWRGVPVLRPAEHFGQALT